MKKLFTLTLALMALTVFVSCGEDEAPFGDNELVIDGDVMPLVGNWYYDYPTDLSQGLPRRTDEIVIVEPVTTHVRRYISFTDASSNNNANIYVEFYSKGDTFENGTYTVKSYNDEVNADTESFVIISVYANSEVYPFSGFDGMSGKITISSDVEEIDVNDIILKFNLAGVAYVPIVLQRQEGGATNEVNVNVKGQFQGEVLLD